MAFLPHRFPLRLKRTVEVFSASDGATYLLRAGTGEDLVIDAPQPHEPALLRLLRDGAASPRELREGLAALGHDVDTGTIDAALADLGRLGLLEEPPDDRLDAEQRERYDRQLAYFADMRPGRAGESQHALTAARVTIVGVGGLGSWTAVALACAGVGHLVLIDDDAVDLSNLNRQLLYRRADVGRSKVEAAAEALTAFNPSLDVDARPMRVTSEPEARRAVAGADFVVDTADSPPYAIGRWLNRACVEAGVPRISAGQFPPRIRIGPTYVPGRTGCLECQERAGRRAYPLYDELAAFRRRTPTVAATLGPASGIIGSALGMEILHHITGIAAPATLGCGIVVDLRDLSMTRAPVERDPACPVCGEGRFPH